MTVTIPITVPPLPRLPGDAGIRLEAGPLVERQIAWALLHCLRAEFPDRKLRIDDGDGAVPVDDMVAAMDMIFSVSASHVLFGKQWVFLVTGNKDCLISDYGVNEQVERAVRSAERIVGITDGGESC